MLLSEKYDQIVKGVDQPTEENIQEAVEKMVNLGIDYLVEESNNDSELFSNVQTVNTIWNKTADKFKEKFGFSIIRKDGFEFYIDEKFSELQGKTG